MRPSWIEVDLGAVAHNLREIAAAVAPAEVCGVVKADAYGHGAVAVARRLVEAGVSRLAVALVEEGRELREAGLEVPILLLSEPPDEAMAEVVRSQLTPTVYRREALSALCESAPPSYPVHVKLDTGMHRVGAGPDEALELAGEVAASELRLEGVWTHFPVAESDPAFTAGQLQELRSLLRRLEDRGLEPEAVHAANTAGALLHPEARLDLVRIGLGIYGLRPAAHVAPELPLRPAMRLLSQVSFTRSLPAGARPSYGRRRPLPGPSTVATFPVGYADGLPRAWGDRGGRVLVRGRSFPFAGTITMDQAVVDAGQDAVEVGDEVVLLGRQGEEEITADEWAERLETINYEVVSRMGSRLPRRYVG